MVSCGLSPGTGTNIGIYAQNCPEWILTEQAVYCYSMVLVPLYDTLGPDACAFIIKQGEIFKNKPTAYNNRSMYNINVLTHHHSSIAK